MPVWSGRIPLAQTTSLHCPVSWSSRWPRGHCFNRQRNDPGVFWHTWPAPQLWVKVRHSSTSKAEQHIIMWLILPLNLIPSWNFLSHLTAMATNKWSYLSYLSSAWAETYMYRGTGGTVPPKFEVGTAHASVPRPIFLEIVFVGCARKHEQSKKRCHQRILFWNTGFSREERVIYDIKHSKDMENLNKDRKKSERHGRCLKKVIRNLWKFFPKKTSLRNLGLRIFFPSPPNSASGLRLWS